MKKLQQQEDSFRDNSLLTVRYLAAFSVLFGHVVAHLSIPKSGIMIKGIGLLSGLFPGVPIFFFMSGYLIWNSVCRTTEITTYYQKRFWRIYPELWLAVALSILSILVFVRPISWLRLSLFTLTQGTILQFWTPAFLRGFGCGTPNGSLWTICVLIQFYAVAVFLRPLLKGKSAKWCLFSVAVSFAIAYLVEIGLRSASGGGMELIRKLYHQTLLPYLWIFLSGCAACEHFQTVIPWLKRWWFLPFCIAVAMRYLTVVDLHLQYAVFQSCLMNLGLLGFAYAFPNCKPKVDFTYGLYIYHMVVVNVMIELGLTGRQRFFLAALLLTVLLSIVSMMLSKWIQSRMGSANRRSEKVSISS